MILASLLLAGLAACDTDTTSSDGPPANFTAGIYELAGHRDGIAFFGHAMVTQACPRVMHRCINGQYSKGSFISTTFPYPEEHRVTAMRYDDESGDLSIMYRVFADLNNTALMVGYHNTHGSEHLLFQETDEFRCADQCIPMDSNMRYNLEKEPCAN